MSIRPIIVKEFKHIIRDWRTLTILIFIPAVLLILIGYAVNFDIKNVSIAVYDNENTYHSRKLIQGLINTGYFEIKYYLSDINGVDKLLLGGEVQGALIIPDGFDDKIQSGDELEIQIIIDGTESHSAIISMGYLLGYIQDYWGNVILKVLEKGGLRVTLPVELKPVIWYNPELKSSKFLIPGLIQYILMLCSIIATSLSLVREKEKGTIEQLIISPIKPIHILVGKILPYILIILISEFLILMVSYFLFGVRVQGSYFLIFLTSIVFICSALGIGILISSISPNQLIAFTISIFFSVLPAFLLSGFFIPISNMPYVIQLLTNLFPGKFFLIILRGIILKGQGLEYFTIEIFFLIIYSLITITLGTLILKKRVFK